MFNFTNSRYTLKELQHATFFFFISNTLIVFSTRQSSGGFGICVSVEFGLTH